MKLKAVAIGCLILALGQAAARSQTLPKRIRWSTPLCKEVDAQGREVGKIDAAIVRCDQVYSGGQSIRTIDGQQLHVAVIAGYYEDYYVADLFVANDRRDDRVDVLSDKAVFVYWKKQNEAPQVSGPIPPEKIAAKIQKRAEWRTFLTSLSAALATHTVQVNTSTTGTASVIGSGGSATGIYSENSTSTVRVPNTELQRQAAARNDRTMIRAEERGDVFTSHALQSTTLFPGDQIRGALFFEKKKFLVGEFAIEIAGTNFEFGVGPPDK